MEDVLSIVKEWWDEIQTGKQLRHFRVNVTRRLSARREPEADSGDNPLAIATSDDVLLDMIADLVELEKKVTMSKICQREADRYLEARPELFLSRVVQHFRYLFNVKTVDGIFPKLNEVYLYCSEMENFARVLGAMVGLDQKTSTSNLLSAVQIAIRRNSSRKGEESKEETFALGHQGQAEEGKEVIIS